MRNVPQVRLRKTISTAEGVFRLIDLPPGKYQLNVAGAGYEIWTEADVTITAGQVLIHDLKLIALPVPNPTTPGLPQLPRNNASTTATESSAPGYSGAKQSHNLQSAAQTRRGTGDISTRRRSFPGGAESLARDHAGMESLRTGGEYPYVKGSQWDPFDRNRWKGDVPIFGQQTFLNITAISDTLLDERRVPSTSNVSSARPGSSEFFGKGEQFSWTNIPFSRSICFTATLRSVRWTGGFE